MENSNLRTKEVIEALQKAKAFATAFILLVEQLEAAQGRVANHNGEKKDICDDCGEEKVEGPYSTYCRSCYIKRKEENWQKTKRW